MENLDIFREAELHFIYRHHRHVLLVQCFQEKFEIVKNRIQELRSHLSSILLPVKSPILSRYYSKSNEIQRFAGMNKFDQLYRFLFLYFSGIIMYYYY
jgi:hypothetical protein